METERIELGGIGTLDGTGEDAKEAGDMFISNRHPCGTQPERTISLSCVAVVSR